MGDPASNPNLEVEVVDLGLAGDTPVVVLIAPWTLCGLAQSPDGGLPQTLRVGHRDRPVLANEVDSIGMYQSVILVPDVSGYSNQEQARTEAERLGAGFRQAVESARVELTQVRDNSRRRLLKGLATDVPSSATSGTAYGTPSGTGPSPAGNG